MNSEQRGEDWFEDLYRAHHRAVVAYAVRRVGPDEADDVAAAVFLTAWRKRDEVPDQALPWLYRTASHHVQHARRGEARRGRLAARPELRPIHPEADTGVEDAFDAHDLVHAMLARLPARDAEVLRLAAWENLTPADIATVLGVSAATARVRLHRARRRGEAVLRALDVDEAGGLDRVPDRPDPDAVAAPDHHGAGGSHARPGLAPDADLVGATRHRRLHVVTQEVSR